MCFMLFFIIVIIIIVIFFFSLSFPSCLCLDLSFSLPPIFFFIPSFSFPLSPSPLPLTSSLPPFLFPSSSPFLSFHFWRFFKQAYFTMNWTIKTIYLYILDIICYFFIKRTFIEKEKKWKAFENWFAIPGTLIYKQIHFNLLFFGTWKQRDRRKRCDSPLDKYSILPIHWDEEVQLISPRCDVTECTIREKENGVVLVQIFVFCFPFFSW